MNELALFAGAGGGILAGELLGWRCLCAVERNAYCAQVLAQRQNDRLLRPFPIWSDVCSFDGLPWRGRIDVVSGGFPCQDVSVSGPGGGIEGGRSGLWSEFRRVVGEVRPRFSFIENSPMLTFRGLDRVLCDLAELGYHASWGVVSAADVGAPHKRDRIWVVAISEEHRSAILADTNGSRGPLGLAESSRRSDRYADKPDNSSNAGGWPYRRSGLDWWAAECGLDRLADGVAHRVDRLAASGNGQVPLSAALAWSLLVDALL